MTSRTIRLFSFLLLISMPLAALAQTVRKPDTASAETPVELIIRIDDLGMCHGANMALKRILETGVVTSVSVMVNSPWLMEAVEILKAHPNVSVGVHLTLNCEWKEFRLGPVSPAKEVPTLVDQYGHFFGTKFEMMIRRPKLSEIETELRAQLERAQQVGLKISYCDYHMGAAVQTREFQEIVEKLSQEYKIGISRYFGEVDAPNVFRPAPAEKLDWAVEIIKALPDTGRHLMVFHPGSDIPEMAVMTDLNKSGVSEMSAHRQAEADVLCSPKFRAAIEAKGFKLVGYQDFVPQERQKMQRPWDSPPYEEVVTKAITAIKGESRSGD